MNGAMADPTWPSPRCVAQSAKLARPGYSDEAANEFLDGAKTLKAKVAAAAAILHGAKRCCVYTGAGISTASGIGDYASIASKSVAPHRAANAGRGNRLEARPTASHLAIAALQRAGFVHHWLQQNHDRLAQKAGFPQAKLNEIHGAWGDDKNPVVMMDGELRGDLDEWLDAWTETADVVLAVGTSLCGMHADCVAQRCASAPDRHLLIVNLQPTPMDAESSVRVWALLDTFFALLLKELGVKPATVSACAKAGEEWDHNHPRCYYRTPPRKEGAPL